jgi:hypothetical protein
MAISGTHFDSPAEQDQHRMPALPHTASQQQRAATADMRTDDAWRAILYRDQGQIQSNSRVPNALSCAMPRMRNPRDADLDMWSEPHLRKECVACALSACGRPGHRVAGGAESTIFCATYSVAW